MEDFLQLQIGSTLQLQQVGTDNPVRHQVRLIGYLPGASVVVSTPRVNGKSILVREGQPFAVRLLRGSAVQGFMTKVLQAPMKPYPHLHLSYPKELESIVVRNAQRVETSIPAVMRNLAQEGSEVESMIVDLSASGARVVTKRAAVREGDPLMLIFDLEVAGDEEGMSLAGEVRNIREVPADPETGRGERYYYGIQFHSVNRLQQIIIHGHVLEKVLDSEGKRPG